MRLEDYHIKYMICVITPKKLVKLISKVISTERHGITLHETEDYNMRIYNFVTI